MSDNVKPPKFQTTSLVEPGFFASIKRFFQKKILPEKPFTEAEIAALDLGPQQPKPTVTITPANMRTLCGDFDVPCKTKEFVSNTTNKTVTAAKSFAVQAVIIIVIAFIVIVFAQAFITKKAEKLV